MADLARRMKLAIFSGLQYRFHINEDAENDIGFDAAWLESQVPRRVSSSSW